MRSFSIIVSIDDIHWHIGGYLDRLMRSYGGSYECISESEFLLHLINYSINDQLDDNFFQTLVCDEFHDRLSALTGLVSQTDLHQVINSNYLTECVCGIIELIRCSCTITTDQMVFGDWRVIQVAPDLFQISYNGDLRIREWYQLKGLPGVDNGNVIDCGQLRRYLQCKLNIRLSEITNEIVISELVNALIQELPNYGPSVYVPSRVLNILERSTTNDVSDIITTASTMLAELYLSDIEALREKSVLSQRVVYEYGVLCIA